MTTPVHPSHTRSGCSLRIGLVAGLGLLVGGLVVSVEVLSLALPALTTKGSPATIALGALPTVGRSPPGIPTSGLLLAVVTNIRDALAVLDTERTRTVAERDAFDAFAQAIWQLDVTKSHRNHSPQDPSRLIGPNWSRTDPGLQSVRQAYRETIMDMSHYAEEYDEALAENMTAEFGEELAVAVIEGQQLSTQLQGVLVQAAVAARKRREGFIDVLDEERTALDAVRARLTTIEEQFDDLTSQPRYEQSLDDLIQRYHQLDEYVVECEQVVDERQAQRTQGHAAEPHTEAIVDLQEYVYRSCEVTYPVLEDGSAMLDRLQTARQRIEDDLARRS